nr:Chain B, ELKS1b [Rattus norvegicus]
CDQDEEEGIWA